MKKKKKNKLKDAIDKSNNKTTNKDNSSVNISNATNIDSEEAILNKLPLRERIEYSKIIYN